MTPAEAIDLLSIAARSSTWDARPADAAALLEVVTRQEELLRAEGAEVRRLDRQVMSVEMQRDEARAEVERLRAHLAMDKKWIRALSDDSRAQMTQLDQVCDAIGFKNRTDETDVAGLVKAEVERLRALLAARTVERDNEAWERRVVASEDAIAKCRDIAARQREACAAFVADGLTSEYAELLRRRVRATPLVTDGPVAHADSPTVVEVKP